MFKKIDGKKYDTETATVVGSTSYCDGEEILFKKANGEYFFSYYDGELYHGIYPISNFRAIQWGMENLNNAKFERNFGATKEDFMSLANSTVEHRRSISKEENQYVQADTLTTKISLYSLENKSKFLLDYWWVEDFDRAYIDWENHEIVLVHTAEHYVPKDHALEMLDLYDTIDLTKED